jgi:hypothetical protein
METRHDDSDGSDIFWPGYVDATTNLILNLLFLLTILIVAVFMFALELGRTSPIRVESKAPVTATKPAAEAVSLSGAALAAPADLVQENTALKREIERLNGMLAPRLSPKAQAGGLERTVDATANVPKPRNGIDRTVVSDLEIIVRFNDEAVSFTPLEHDQLLEKLKPFAETGKTDIYVEVPAGFSEAKRMGFYRAMAVRNLLIELKIPTENIDVSVLEGKSNANASLVKVRAFQ